MVVPNVYVNIELVVAISNNYRLDTREIVAKEGGRLTAITKEVTDEVFMVNPKLYWAINPKEL